MSNKYVFFCSWSTDDNQFVGRCEQYPSMSWLADTAREALAGIMQLVAEELKDE